MKKFCDDDFLLSSQTAKLLFEGCLALPIIDYHCHLNAREIYEDRSYDNITQVWLEGDHYKWRLMRAQGITERLITGDACDFEKFEAFLTALRFAPGNPVYHWTHLELKKYFNYSDYVRQENALELWDHCNAVLRDGLGTRKIICGSNVETIITTDDPLDGLEWHERLKADESFDVAVLPAWRPDKVFDLSNPEYPEYIAKLGDIGDVSALCAVLADRMDYFACHGCRSADHGIESLGQFEISESEADSIFKSALRRDPVSPPRIAAFRFYMLKELGAEYAERGWVMQIHYGAKRNLNTRYYRTLGPDTGFDAIAPNTDISALPVLLDSLDRRGVLPKTIIFPLDPAHNAMVNTICGSFQREGVKGHVQPGAAWWFNDHIRGIQEQMRSTASHMPISVFLGMVTDSRSFLSYPRHEYFRRILCNMLGSLVEDGEYPYDIDTLHGIIRGICYQNVREYFAL